jgi:hypothetical protein
MDAMDAFVDFLCHTVYWHDSKSRFSIVVNLSAWPRVIQIVRDVCGSANAQIVAKQSVLVQDTIAWSSVLGGGNDAGRNPGYIVANNSASLCAGQDRAIIFDGSHAPSAGALQESLMVKLMPNVPAGIAAVRLKGTRVTPAFAQWLMASVREPIVLAGRNAQVAAAAFLQPDRVYTRLFGERREQDGLITHFLSTDAVARAQMRRELMQFRCVLVRDASLVDLADPRICKALLDVKKAMCGGTLMIDTTGDGADRRRSEYGLFWLAPAELERNDILRSKADVARPASKLTEVAEHARRVATPLAAPDLVATRAADGAKRRLMVKPVSASELLV